MESPTPAAKTAFFGSTGLADAVARHATDSTAEIAESIYQAAMHYSNGQLSDDAALLVLKPKAISAPRPFSGSPPRWKVESVTQPIPKYE